MVAPGIGLGRCDIRATSQWEPIQTVLPVLGFGEMPDQQNVFDHVPDRDFAGYENQAGAMTFLDALVKPARHCGDIMRSHGPLHQNGRPLQVHGDKVYSKSGVIVGRIRNDRVYGTDGRYVGTIVGDRLVYRSTHSARVVSSFGAGDRGGAGLANRGASGIWGDEPDIAE